MISTYNTVSADWGGGQKAAGSVLFSTPWKRIILDEGLTYLLCYVSLPHCTDASTTAHVIRNTQSQMSRAVCALEATARWAVTGTPIQNRIGDLAALLKFIRAYPYHDARRFELDIGQMWKTGKIEEAVKRLRKLSGGLILRRPKTVIELPPRTDLKFPIEFRPSERELYEKIKHHTMARIEEAFRDGDSGGLGSTSYITVMQRINALRMICDLGLNYEDRHHLTAAEDAHTHSDLRDWSTVAQEAFNLQRDLLSSVVCAICASSCDIIAAPFTSDSTEASQQSYFAECLSFICSDCAQPSLRRNQPIMCGHTSNHSVAPVSLSWTALEEPSVLSDLGITSGFSSSAQHAQLSSKVMALVSQLRGLPDGTKR